MMSAVCVAADEEETLRRAVREWAYEYVEPQALAHDRDEVFNRDLFERAGRDLGILGPTLEVGAKGACVIAEELSYRDPAFCLSWMAHSILFVHNLSQNGSEALTSKFLPRCLDGSTIGAMCMTEPEAGTDVLGMRTTATREGDSFVLEGRKTWITNGSEADVMLVYAKTDDKISLFLVEADTPGFSVGQRILNKCGMRASPTAELVFDGCRVPSTHLVGDLGKGTIPMMRNLEIERLVLAAMSVGIARRCLDVARTYASERRAFGRPLVDFGQIQRHIAESYAECAAAKTFLYHVCDNPDAARLDSDAVKLFAAKTATTIADRAVQVLGGYGYVADSAVSRLWRDAKLLEIGGGTLESHQKNIVNDLHRFHADQPYLE